VTTRRPAGVWTPAVHALFHHLHELERDETSVESGRRGVGSGGPQTTIVFSQTDEPKAGKSGLHLEVNATDRHRGGELDRDDELDRSLEAGAYRVDIGQTGAGSRQVLAGS
jgi:hypothetical protein